MKPYSRLIQGLGLLAVALGLLRWPQDISLGVVQGLTLCYQVIFPALFPFFILSALVISLGLSGPLGRLFQGVMFPLFRLNGACGNALVLGLIGGYPVGAKTALGLYQAGACTRIEAQRMLAFCNNAGPAFLLGVVGAEIFGSNWVGALLYLAHLLASFGVGILFRFYGREEATSSNPVAEPPALPFSSAFLSAVTGAFSATLQVCAFILCFAVISALLRLSGALDFMAGLLNPGLALVGVDQAFGQSLILGGIELVSGVMSIPGDAPLAPRIVLASFFLGWAGLSVHCQVLSLLEGSDLSPGTYLLGKALHGLLAALISLALLSLLPQELRAVGPFSPGDLSYPVIHVIDGP